MNTIYTLRGLLATFVLVTAGSAQVPTSQPSLLTIVREEVKFGHADDHARHEAGWPAAYARAKSPDYYLALVSMTGPTETWYMGAYASHAALGEAMKRDAADPVLSAELARLYRGDAAHVNSTRTTHVTGRPDLTQGAFPDLGLVRFFEVTTLRVRPGFEQGFEAVAKAFQGAARRVAPNAAWRVYEVAAGMPSPTYLIVSTYKNLGEMDAAMKDLPAMIGAMSADDQAALQKFSREGTISNESQRFRLDPGQSYVDADTKAKDPAFWNPRRPARPAGQ
jgi:hypothetical protein